MVLDKTLEDQVGRIHPWWWLEEWAWWVYLMCSTHCQIFFFKIWSPHLRWNVAGVGFQICHAQHASLPLLSVLDWSSRWRMVHFFQQLKISPRTAKETDQWPFLKINKTRLNMSKRRNSNCLYLLLVFLCLRSYKSILHPGLPSTLCHWNGSFQLFQMPAPAPCFVVCIYLFMQSFG